MKLARDLKSFISVRDLHHILAERDRQRDR